MSLYPDEERCRALHPATRPSGSLRCVKQRGHTDEHYARAGAWDNESTDK